MPIPPPVRDADAAGLRQILAEAARMTRPRGFLGQAAPIGPSTAELEQNLKRELWKGAAWLASLDPNRATEAAFPVAQPLVKRMPELAQWAIIKLMILELYPGAQPAPTAAAGPSDKIDYRRESWEDLPVVSTLRRNLESKVAEASPQLHDALYGLSGPKVGIDELLAAAKIQIDALQAGIAHTIERTLRAAECIEITNPVKGRDMAAKLNDLAERHGLAFCAPDGTAGKLIYAQHAAKSTFGGFALSGPAGVSPLAEGLAVLVAIPRAQQKVQSIGLTPLREKQLGETYEAMKALVFGAEAPSLAAFRRYASKLAKRDADQWTDASRREAVEALNFWKGQLRAEFFYGEQPCGLRTKARGRQGFQVRGRGSKPPTLYTGMTLPVINIRGQR